jgi:hypothetical protein
MGAPGKLLSNRTPLRGQPARGNDILGGFALTNGLHWLSLNWRASGGVKCIQVLLLHLHVLHVVARRHGVHDTWVQWVRPVFIVRANLLLRHAKGPRQCDRQLTVMGEMVTGCDTLGFGDRFARVGHLDGNVSSTKSECIPSLLPSRSEVTFLKVEPRATRPRLPGWRTEQLG